MAGGSPRESKGRGNRPDASLRAVALTICLAIAAGMITGILSARIATGEFLAIGARDAAPQERIWHRRINTGSGAGDVAPALGTGAEAGGGASTIAAAAAPSCAPAVAAAASGGQPAWSILQLPDAHPDNSLPPPQLAERLHISDTYETGAPLTGPSDDPARPNVVAIMWLYGDARTLPLALDSSRGFVTQYVIVVRPGIDDTAAVLRACIDKWSLRARVFIGEMTPRQARFFARRVSQHYTQIYLVQDGDEIYYDAGPTALPNVLRLLRTGEYRCVASKQVMLKGSLQRAPTDTYSPGGPGKWGGHPANGIVSIPLLMAFLNGPATVISEPADERRALWDCFAETALLHDVWRFKAFGVKHPVRLMVHNNMNGWIAAGAPGSPEDFLRQNDPYYLSLLAADPSLTLADVAARFIAEHGDSGTSMYVESEWWRFPAAIRKYLDAGFVAGYEGGSIL